MTPQASWEMFLQTCQKLGIGAQQSALQSQVARLRGLTPGDFEQLWRRCKLQPVNTAAALVQHLEAALKLKRTASKGAMGFSP